VYGYPPALAAEVAVATLRDELARSASIDVQLCCFSEAMRAICRQALNAA